MVAMVCVEGGVDDRWKMRVIPRELCVSVFMCRRLWNRGEEMSAWQFVRVSDSWDSCQGWCSPNQRSAAGIAPEQPEGKCGKTHAIQGRCEGRRMIEQRKRRGVKHRVDGLSQFSERQFDG